MLKKMMWNILLPSVIKFVFYTHLSSRPLPSKDKQGLLLLFKNQTLQKEIIQLLLDLL